MGILGVRQCLSQIYSPSLTHLLLSSSTPSSLQSCPQNVRRPYIHLHHSVFSEANGAHIRALSQRSESSTRSSRLHTGFHALPPSLAESQRQTSRHHSCTRSPSSHKSHGMRRPTPSPRTASSRNGCTRASSSLNLISSSSAAAKPVFLL